MVRVTRLAAFGLFFLSSLAPSVFSQDEAGAIPYGDNGDVGKFAEVNGIQMYYEVYGSGAPVVMIHGSGNSIGAMKHQIEYFSKSYQVIAIDSRGHGKSGASSSEYTYELFTDDIAGLLDHLELDSTLIIGWSDGGIIGLLMGIHHPTKVRMIAAMGANLRPDSSAVYQWAIDYVAENVLIVDEMIASKDTTADWSIPRRLLTLLGENPNIPLEDVGTIQAPVLLLSGDRDIIKLEHTVEMFYALPNAQLCVFPGVTHWAPAGASELFNASVDNFFKAPFSKPESKDILLGTVPAPK